VRGVFAFGSVGTLAFTFASQGLLTQFMSGVFLILSNKMYVGDFVRFGDSTSGVVTKLGWMETTLRQGDNTVLNVPNAALASQKVSNVSRIRQCQVQQTLRLDYNDVDKIPQLIESIRHEIEKACPKLITNGTRPFRVYWTEFNEDHLEIMVNVRSLAAQLVVSNSPHAIITHLFFYCSICRLITISPLWVMLIGKIGKPCSWQSHEP
jgi:small-conductance mechanosensitive channel